ncbi:hypothetical protein B0H13DRAFT_739043 [Mycena leptocephala]|nr:hypothetical protein B0H13DRAFT_739043 [Mycena leptocephala]
MTMTMTEARRGGDGDGGANAATGTRTVGIKTGAGAGAACTSAPHTLHTPYTHLDVPHCVRRLELSAPGYDRRRGRGRRGRGRVNFGQKERGESGDGFYFTLCAPYVRPRLDVPRLHTRTCRVLKPCVARSYSAPDNGTVRVKARGRRGRRVHCAGGPRARHTPPPRCPTRLHPHPWRGGTARCLKADDEDEDEDREGKGGGVGGYGGVGRTLTPIRPASTSCTSASAHPNRGSVDMLAEADDGDGDGGWGGERRRGGDTSVSSAAARHLEAKRRQEVLRAQGR